MEKEPMVVYEFNHLSQVLQNGMQVVVEQVLTALPETLMED